MSTYELEHICLAEAILCRPKMYTATGSLSEILALFVGFDEALRYGSGCIDKSPSYLLEWIIDQCAIQRYSTPPVLQVERILEHFGNADLALGALQEHAKKLRKN